ncbi:MAG: hypothetical protein JKY80_00145 [Mariprofundaceae bacterium]|nr:hypothetical protein [Mariprofundaceae bacterium]
MGNTKNLLPARKAKHWPAITEPKRIGEFMRSIYAYQGTFVVCQALKLLPLVAARSGELRYSQWPEFDFETALWTIPAIHRKLPLEEKEDSANVHLVPLSKQAIQILKDLQQLTGNARYVFPSQRSDDKPMSDDAINDAIERQLAHKVSISTSNCGKQSAIIALLNYTWRICQGALPIGQ